ncbi:NAD(P)H-quinone oxidoreductase subunit I [Sporomusa carbonis]|uniref:4Fe-4S dicluster domain-containing protein n=1 Tax=Sporomusa carbonis TaxID=3076075 RepID=UPI003A6A216D
MGSYLKTVIQNLLKGPSTDPYPFGKTFEPKGLRGKIRFNSQACVACRTCEHVCAGNAIRIKEAEDKSGLHFVVWHNTCAFCGLCEHYCPTKAIRMTADYHTAHSQAEKYNYVEQGFIKYVPCSCCGKPMIPVAAELLALAYKETANVEFLAQLCERCRPGNRLRKEE